MTLHGICHNANIDDGTLTTEQLRAWRPSWLRTVTYWSDNFQYWDRVILDARRKRVAGANTLVVFNTEAAGCDVDDLEIYTRRLDEFLRRSDGVITAIECGNELDTPWWTTSRGEPISTHLMAEIAKRGAELCHKYSVTPIAPSLLSGPSEGTYAALTSELRGDVTIVSARMKTAVHPYYCSIRGGPSTPGENGSGASGQWRFGSVEQKANECAEIAPDFEVWFTELGCPTRFDGIGEDGQAEYTDAFCAFQHPQVGVMFQFSANDAMVPPGEIAEGKDWGIAHKPAGRVFHGELAIPGHVTDAMIEAADGERPVYVLGFAEAHNAAPDLIGEPLRNEYGPIPGVSTQATEHGVLLWADAHRRGARNGQSVVMFVAHDGREFVFNRGRMEQVA